MAVQSLFYKFLHIISTNSKLTTKQLAKELQTSQQNVSYMFKKAKEEQLISSYETLVDPSRFGYDSFIVLLKLKKSSKKTLNEIHKSAQEFEEITGCYALFGSYELLLKFTCYNASSFNKVLKSFLTSIQEIVISSTILTQIVEYYLSPTYMSKKRLREIILIGADRNVVPINEKEKFILKHIQNDARVSSSQIAFKLSTTAKTVIETTKRLEKKEIIKGTITNYNPHLLDINQYLIFLRVSFGEDENVVLKYLRTVSNITRITKVFGEWDFVIQFESFNLEDLQDHLEHVKEEFNILDYHYITITRRYFWRTIPKIQ